MTPFSCAASSASAICWASVKVSVHGEWPAGNALGEGFSFDKLHYQEGLCFFQGRGGPPPRLLAPRLRFAPRSG